ncbi:hypothetical protein FQN54_009608 [Arachnomyces sp. PD_36]|nr:hypothetical protein FQN54_009608 [Arachnomyces sp. PD_36]
MENFAVDRSLLLPTRIITTTATTITITAIEAAVLEAVASAVAAEFQKNARKPALDIFFFYVMAAISFVAGLLSACRIKGYCAKVWESRRLVPALRAGARLENFFALGLRWMAFRGPPPLADNHALVALGVRSPRAETSLYSGAQPPRPRGSRPLDSPPTKAPPSAPRY